MKKLILSTMLVFAWLVPNHAQPATHTTDNAATYAQQVRWITKEEAIEIVLQSLNLTDRDEFLSNVEMRVSFYEDELIFPNAGGVWFIRFDLAPANGDPVPVDARFSILVSGDGKEVEYSY